LGDLKDRLIRLAEGLGGFYEDGPGDLLKWKGNLRLTLQLEEYQVLLELLVERYVERAANLRSKIEDLEERSLALDQTIGREVQVTGVGDVPCRQDPCTGKSYLCMQAKLGEKVNELMGLLAAWAQDMDKPGDARGHDDETPSHSEDFTSVNWYGTRYEFTKGLQARTIAALWGDGEPFHTLTLETIEDKLGRSDSRKPKLRLDHVFRDHRAWGTVVQQPTKGSFRLVPPA
jgi:hypothetical protein